MVPGGHLESGSGVPQQSGPECLRTLACLGWGCLAAVSASLSLPSHLSCGSLGRQLRGSSVHYLRGEVSVPSQDSVKVAWLSREGGLWVQRAEGTARSLGAPVASGLQGHLPSAPQPPTHGSFLSSFVFQTICLM